MRYQFVRGHDELSVERPRRIANWYLKWCPPGQTRHAGHADIIRETLDGWRGI